MRVKTDSEIRERPQKFGLSSFLSSNTWHTRPGRHFVPCKTDFEKEKTPAVLQSTVAAKREIAETIIIFSIGKQVNELFATHLEAEHFTSLTNSR